MQVTQKIYNVWSDEYMQHRLCSDSKIKAGYSITDQFLSVCINSFCADWGFKVQGSISKAHYFLTDGYRHCQLDIQASRHCWRMLLGPVAWLWFHLNRLALSSQTIFYLFFILLPIDRLCCTFVSRWEGLKMIARLSESVCRCMCNIFITRGVGLSSLALPIACSTKEGAPCQKVSPWAQTRRQSEAYESKSSTLGSDFFQTKLFLGFKILEPEQTDQILLCILVISIFVLPKVHLYLSIPFSPGVPVSYTPSVISSNILFSFSAKICFSICSVFLFDANIWLFTFADVVHLFSFFSRLCSCVYPPSLFLLSAWWWWMGPMDEWAVRGAVMKTGLGGEKVRVRGVCVGGNMKEREKQGMQTEGLREAAKGGDKEHKTGRKLEEEWRRSGWRWRVSAWGLCG